MGVAISFIKTCDKDSNDDSAWLDALSYTFSSTPKRTKYEDTLMVVLDLQVIRHQKERKLLIGYL